MASRAAPQPSSGPSWWRRALGWPAFYFVIVLLGLVELGWLIPALVIHLVVPQPRARRIGRAVISFVFRNYFRLTRACGVLEVDDAELAALDPREAMIIAPNHPTGLDALILIARLDDLNCIMKASMLDNLFLGAGARLAGYIRNDGPRRMFRQSTEDLRRGGQLIIFPEATRTRAAPVNPFKGGFAAMARVAGVPIQTILVETNTPYLSKGWSSVKKPPVLPMKFRVRLGRRFVVPATGDLTPFVEHMQAYFAQELADAPLGRLWDPDRVVVGEVEDVEAAAPACGIDHDRGERRGEAATGGVPSLNTSR